MPSGRPEEVLLLEEGRAVCSSDRSDGDAEEDCAGCSWSCVWDEVC